MHYLGFLNRVQKLRWIDRCSNTPHIKPYSVAQHSFYAAMYAVVFSSIENESHRYEKYNLGIVAQKALVHDLEESVTGDILFPIHNQYEEFKSKLDFIRDRCVEKEVFKELSDQNKQFFIKLWKEAKDDTNEGKMVACMDKFEILMYIISEMEIGNHSVPIVEIYTNAIIIIKEQFGFIGSVIGAVTDIESVYGEVM